MDSKWLPSWIQRVLNNLCPMNCCVAGNNTKSTKYDTDNNNDDDDDDNNNNLAVHDP